MLTFEKSNGTNKHSITSDQVLLDKETGRVVAVFYNDYDLDSVLQLQDEVEHLKSELSYVQDIRCN